MKKVVPFIIISFVFVFIVNGSAFAEKTNSPEFPNNYEANHSFLEFFILDLYHEEIIHHLKNQYGVDVSGYALANDGKPNVSLRHTHGLDGVISEKYSFLIRIRLIPTKNSELREVKQSDIVNVFMAVNPDVGFIKKKKSAVKFFRF